jgi:hypothetical protein
VLASTNNQNVAASVDNVITTSANNKYISPGKVQAIAAQALNDFLTRSRINAPSLRNEGLPEVFPLRVGTVPATNPDVAYWRDVGPTFQPNEEIGLEISCGASVALVASGALYIQDKRDPIPPGKRMRIFGTSTITLVANAWASGNITLDQTLPYGTYAVIGMAAKLTNGFLARLIFPRTGVWRPGCPASPSTGQADFAQYFLAGNLGLWGIFNSIAQPLVEVFGITAGSQTVNLILDLVQVSLGG